MADGALSLFKITNADETADTIDRLELSSPPRLLFENVPEISQVYQTICPAEKTVDDVWLPTANNPFPDARIVSTDRAFAPDFFFLSYEFFSASLRDIMGKFSQYIEYVDTHPTGSCEEFLEKDYKMAIFPSLSPFDRLYSDITMEYFKKGEYPPKLKVREDFEPVSPIFNLATGPWLMCTEEVVAEVMPHPVSGLTFVNYETDEILIPGS